MAMKRSRKVAIGVLLGLVAVVAVTIVYQKRKGTVTDVQAGLVVRKELVSLVTASGEIRPLSYTNITAQSFGKITQIYIKEGEQVRAGQILLRQESVQPVANLEANKALVGASEASVEAAGASQRTSEAELVRARADNNRVILSFERAQGLYNESLISQQEYDTRKAEFETSKASVTLAEARVLQSAADLNRARSILNQAHANMRRVEDDFQKTIYRSPINGLITNLPVELGEQMVPGVQNSQASFLLTVADMSAVTAEVKVDETDVVRLALDQEVEVEIDAYPDRKFVGRVTEIGTTALLRSTGQSTAQLQTGTQEAKDFKVVVTLLDPPSTIRPGLSATARITAAVRESALAIPIQALTIRRKSDIEDAERKAAGEDVAEASSLTASTSADKEEIQGVFVIVDGGAEFREVKTGITGVTEIEVVTGLEENEQIVIGSYSVLRSLKHLTKVKIKKPDSGK